MAKKEVIDQDNFNAWRKTVNSKAVDYTSQGQEQDSKSIQWAKDNGYDNSKDYRTKVETAPQETPTAQETPKPSAPELAQKASEEGKSFVQMYQEFMPKPEYDTKKATNVEKAKNLSLIADIIKTIGEGVTTSQGGKPIQRQSQAPVLTAELQRLNELYKSEMKGYKHGGFNALMMDERDKRSRAAAALTEARRIAERANADEWKQKSFDQRERQFASNQKQEDKRISIAATNKQTKDSDAEKFKYIIVNGKSTRVPASYVNDVAAKAKSKADITDPVQTMLPEQVFATNWNNHYDYVNGEFVPKSSAKPQTAAKPKNTFTPGGKNSLIQQKKQVPGF